MIELAERERYDRDPRPIVHKMSFGKDSYGALVAMIENGIAPRHVVYNETGWEALDHYGYLEREKARLLDRYGIDVVTCQAHVELEPALETLAREIEEMVDKAAPGWREWSPGRQAWEGWGGDEGWAWATDEASWEIEA